MAKPKQTFTSVRIEITKELGFFVMRYAVDFLQGCFVLLAIVAFAWIVRLLALLGMDERFVAVFERIHFTASLAIYTVLCIDFVFRLAITVRSRVLAQWRLK